MFVRATTDSDTLSATGAPPTEQQKDGRSGRADCDPKESAGSNRLNWVWRLGAGGEEIQEGDVEGNRREQAGRRRRWMEIKRGLQKSCRHPHFWCRDEQ